MKTIGLIVVAVVLVLAGFSWWNSEPSIRYRLTVAIESGGKAYTGSGVIQVKMHFQEYWSPPALPHVMGDAVVIEVPDHAPIFALMRSASNVDWDADIPFTMFRDLFPKRSTLRERVRMLAQSQAKAEIPPGRYPLIVAFRDLEDPSSIYRVQSDDMSPPLDVGAHVVSIAIEMTNHPVTYQVETHLPWLGREIAAYLDGSEYHFPGRSFANDVGVSDFRKRGS